MIGNQSTFLFVLNSLPADGLKKILSSVNFRSVKLEAEQAYNTYSLRSRLHLENEELTRQFEALLHKLDEVKNGHVWIHSVIVGDCTYLVFANESNEGLLGCLSFEKKVMLG